MKLNVKRRALAVATAMTVAAAGLLAASPAMAGNSSYCTTAVVCVYADSSYKVGMGWRAAGFALQDVSLINNDRMSSWENRTSKRARWHSDAGGKGTCFNMASYSEKASLPWLAENDKMSSWDGLGKAC